MIIASARWIQTAYTGLAQQVTCIAWQFYYSRFLLTREAVVWCELGLVVTLGPLAQVTFSLPVSRFLLFSSLGTATDH